MWFAYNLIFDGAKVRRFEKKKCKIVSKCLSTTSYYITFAAKIRKTLS